MAALNEKQHRFCEEYLIDLNAKGAYIRAGYADGAGARSSAARLKSNPDVQAHIRALMRQREERTKINQDKVLIELARIGFSSIADYMSIEETSDGGETGEDAQTPANKTSVGKRQLVRIFKTADVQPEKLPAIAEIRQTRDGVSLKLHDKTRALDIIGKHLGMYTEKPCSSPGGAGGALSPADRLLLKRVSERLGQARAAGGYESIQEEADAYGPAESDDESL